MNQEFILALHDLEKEKGIRVEILLEVIEGARIRLSQEFWFPRMCA